MVTGDAVVLDVAVAQLPVRALGALIDLVLILAGYVAALMLWAVALPQFDDALTAAILIIFTVTVIVWLSLSTGSPSSLRITSKLNVPS